MRSIFHIAPLGAAHRGEIVYGRSVSLTRLLWMHYRYGTRRALISPVARVRSKPMPAP